MTSEDEIEIITIGENRYQYHLIQKCVIGCFSCGILFDRPQFNGTLEKEAQAIEHAKSLKNRSGI